jgi:phosphomannomutase
MPILTHTPPPPPAHITNPSFSPISLIIVHYSKTITDDMRAFMKRARQVCTLGIVGGSDFNKIKEQIGEEVLSEYDFVFGENGLDAYKNGDLLATQSLKAWIEEKKMQKFLNHVLVYIAGLDIPVKRGTFIEYRNGMLNISPIGRNCSYAEREAFNEYDKEHKIRETMVSHLREEFKDLGFTYSIGGQISFDVFPVGWDKSFCLQFLKDFDDIHFFGDKCYKGGNDHEIYVHDGTTGHEVTSPDDTRRIVSELLNIE